MYLAGSAAFEPVLPARVLGPRAKLGVTSIQVPTFLGHGAVLVVETEEDLEPGEAVAVLDKAPSVEV